MEMCGSFEFQLKHCITAIAMVSVVGLSRTSKGGGKNVNYIFLANELNV